MQTNQSKSMMIGRVLCLLLMGALLLPSVAHAQAIKGEEATEADGAKFQNERARQHMLELEQRMFRLAEMLKESQPGMPSVWSWVSNGRVKNSGPADGRRPI